MGFTILYREGTPDEDVLRCSFERDRFFPAVPEYRPRRYDTIIDVGAHIGTFSLLAASKVTKGKVLAVEASEESFDYLRRNIKANSIENIVPIHLALADHKGIARLYRSPEGNWADTITKEVSREYEEVVADTLANLMNDNSIRRCDFMKINCEGAEFPIILSTPREILRRIRTILILYHLDLIAGYSELGLIDRLHECGFRTRIRNRTARRGWIIARNKAFAIRMEELFQYAVWRLCSPLGLTRLWPLFWRLSQPMFNRS